jgi:GNAT superfamily N-acetyltransferase
MPPTSSAQVADPPRPGCSGLVIADLPRSSYEDAIGVLARGMRDNPLHLAAYGTDPDRRERLHGRLMRAFLTTARDNEPIGVWRDGTLVGVAGALVDGGCRPGFAQTLRVLPAVAALGPHSASRVTAWMKVWHEHEPDEPHVHLGPVAVDRRLQGRGIGTLLLAEHCRRLDEAGALGYLETDKPENLHFYERGGYRVVGQADTIGVTSWFMRREPGHHRER